MRFIALLLFIFAMTSPAEAKVTGKEILGACREIASATSTKDELSEEPRMIGHCAGVIEALMVTSRLYSDGTKFCSPENASTSQGPKVLVKFLDEHPQALNEQAIILVLMAFKVAWPCSKAN
jgi:ATP-dependent DNA ligase